MAAIQLGFAVVLVVLQLTFFAHGQHHKDREVAFGWVGAITAILMYISPSWDMVRLVPSLS
jgi:heme/copper-type cytochrome/quinol oxidase subunit 4